MLACEEPAPNMVCVPRRYSGHAVHRAAVSRSAGSVRRSPSRTTGDRATALLLGLSAIAFLLLGERRPADRLFLAARDGHVAELPTGHMVAALFDELLEGDLVAELLA